MITETTYYEVICDHCKEKLCIDCVTAWETEEEAQDALNYAGWQEMQDDTVYCDACLEHGEIDFSNLTEDDE